VSSGGEKKTNLFCVCAWLGISASKQLYIKKSKIKKMEEATECEKSRSPLLQSPSLMNLI